MLTESIILALVAGIFTLFGAGIGAGIAYLSDRKNANEAKKQLYYQYALEEKFTAYRDFYLALDECSARYKQALVSGPGGVDGYEENIFPPYRELRTNWDIASIYIDDEQEIEIIEEALETFNDGRTWLKSLAQASDSDYHRKQPGENFQIGSDDIEEAYDDIVAVLKPKLDPVKFK